MDTSRVLPFDAPAIVRSADAELVSHAVAAEKRRESASWEAADCYAELAKRGWTQQDIANAVKKSQSHVSKFIACAKLFPVGNNRPDFGSAYQDVNSTDPGPAKGSNQAPKMPEANAPDTSGLCHKCATMVKSGKRAYDNCPACASMKTTSKPKPPAQKPAPDTEKEPDEEADSNPFMPRLDALDKRINETMDKIFKARDLSSEDKTKARQLVKATTDVLKALSGAPIRPPQDQACRDCGWECQWVTTVGGGRILLEKEPSYSGRFDIIGGLAVSVQWVKNQKMYANHHMTCLKKRAR